MHMAHLAAWSRRSLLDVARVTVWMGPFDTGSDPIFLQLATHLELPMSLGGLGLSTLLDDVAQPLISEVVLATGNLAVWPGAIRTLCT